MAVEGQGKEGEATSERKLAKSERLSPPSLSLPFSLSLFSLFILHSPNAQLQTHIVPFLLAAASLRSTS